MKLKLTVMTVALGGMAWLGMNLTTGGGPQPVAKAAPAAEAADPDEPSSLTITEVPSPDAVAGTTDPATTGDSPFSVRERSTEGELPEIHPQSVAGLTAAQRGLTGRAREDAGAARLAGPEPVVAGAADGQPVTDARPVAQRGGPGAGDGRAVPAGDPPAGVEAPTVVAWEVLLDDHPRPGLVGVLTRIEQHGLHTGVTCEHIDVPDDAGRAYDLNGHGAPDAVVAFLAALERDPLLGGATSLRVWGEDERRLGFRARWLVPEEVR